MFFCYDMISVGGDGLKIYVCEWLDGLYEFNVKNNCLPGMYEL